MGPNFKYIQSQRQQVISREKESDNIVFYCQVYDSQKENYLEKDERNKNHVGLMFTANNYQLPAYVSSVT